MVAVGRLLCLCIFSKAYQKLMGHLRALVDPAQGEPICWQRSTWKQILTEREFCSLQQGRTDVDPDSLRKDLVLVAKRIQVSTK